MSTLDRKALITLFFSVFATVTGVGIVVPLLPVYAHDLGASGIYIGLIFGAFSLSRTVFMPLFGRLSDRKGRKTFIVPGLLGYALISLTFMYARDVNTLIVIRLFHGVVSAMLMPVIQAYVADLAPTGREGRVMGIYSTFVLLGLSLGPLLGGLVKDNFGLQAAFLCMGLLAMAGCIACLVLLPPARTENVVRVAREPIPWRGLIEDRTIAGLFFIRFSYVVCIGIIWGFVPVYADLTFSLPGASIGILITLGILVSGALNVPMGYLSDRTNRKIMVVTGALLAGYAILSFQWATGYRGMVIASVLFGTGGGICMPAVLAMAALKGQRSEAMGSVMALMTVAHSLGMLVGAILGGVMMDVFHLRYVFPAGAAFIAAGIVVFVLNVPLRRAPVQRRVIDDAVGPG